MDGVGRLAFQLSFILFWLVSALVVSLRHFSARQTTFSLIRAFRLSSYPFGFHATSQTSFSFVRFLLLKALAFGLCNNAAVYSFDTGLAPASGFRFRTPNVCSFSACAQRTKTTRNRGLLLGFERQPCGEGSVGGPVVGVDGVSRSAFVFIDLSIYLFRRLLTASSPIAKRPFVSFRPITAFSPACGLVLSGGR